MTFEALAARRSEHFAAFQAQLAPLKFTLKGQKFLAGETPLYADHIVFGALQWGRKTFSGSLLDGEDVIASWMENLLDYYGGALIGA